MKIIDGIKYKDVYKKTIFKYYTPLCIFCRNRINTGTPLYAGSIAPVRGNNNFVCCECAISPIHAEKAVISLLKILYGGEVRVLRHEYNNSNNYKVFNY